MVFGGEARYGDVGAELEGGSSPLGLGSLSQPTRGVRPPFDGATVAELEAGVVNQRDEEHGPDLEPVGVIGYVIVLVVGFELGLVV